MIRAGSILSRLAALLLLIGVGVGFWAGVGAPVVERLSGGRTRIAETIELRDRFARLASEKEAAMAELEAARRAVDAAGLHLVAVSETLAAAEMRERLNEIVLRYGGELRSVRVTPVEDAKEQGRSIGMRVAMRGGFESLFSTLYAVEAAAPYYFIDSAELKARRARRRRSANPEEEREEILELRFDVTALMRPAGAQ
jgi:hypothetical protein